MSENKNKLTDKFVEFISNNIFWTFLFFVILILTVPHLLVWLSEYKFWKFGLFTADDKGVVASNVIGETVGGITAPLVGMFSALLVYIAFKEQVKANTELQKFNLEQIQYLKNQDIKNEWNNLNSILENIKTHFDKLELEVNTEKEKNIKYKGKEAVKILLTILKLNNVTNTSIFKIDNLNFYSCNAYKEIQYLIFKINSSSVDEFDKVYFYNCIKNYLILDKSDKDGFFNLEKFVHQNKSTTFVHEIDKYRIQYSKLINIINKTNDIFRDNNPK